MDLALEILQDQGPVIRTSRNQAPPRPPPAERAPAGSGADYNFVGRRYKIALGGSLWAPPPPGSAPDPAARRAGALQLRIESAGPGTALTLATPAGAEPYGVARAELSLSVGDGGVSVERFCIVPAGLDPSSPVEPETLRLLVRAEHWEGAAGPVGRALEGGGQQAEERGAGAAHGGEEEGSLVAAFQRLGRCEPALPAPDQPTQISCPRPRLAPGPAGGPHAGRPVSRRPPSADSLDEAASAVHSSGAADEGPGASARRRRLSSAGALPAGVPAPAARLAPPFLHGGDAARDEAARFVAVAAAALQIVAHEVGARHPVDASWAAPRRLLRACADLAAALSLPEIFDTPLFADEEGRGRLRGYLEDLRLSGSADLVEGVYAAWHDALTSVHPDYYQQLEEAEAMAGHCWNCIAVATGPWHVIPHDLLPVGRPIFFALVEKAEEAVGRHAGRPRCSPPAPPPAALSGTSSSAKGTPPLNPVRAPFTRLHPAADADPHLFGASADFTAWSQVIRAGATPSRLEVEVLVGLNEALERDPQRFEEAEVLLQKLYFFTEADPADRFDEVLVLRALAHNVLFRGSAQKAAGMLKRAVGILETLPDEYRAAGDRLEHTLALTSFHVADLAGLVRHVRRMMATIRRLRRHSEGHMDIFWFGRTFSISLSKHQVRPGRAARVLTAEDYAQGAAWALSLVRRFRLLPKSVAPFIEGHMTYQLAMAHMTAGAWSKALACLERAKKDLYDRFPAYFSPRQRRIADLGEAIAACHQRLAAAGGKHTRS
eukprot:tig00000691_g3177.t1